MYECMRICMYMNRYIGVAAVYLYAYVLQPCIYMHICCSLVSVCIGVAAYLIANIHAYMYVCM
jgi:hypothetical protein